MMNLSKLEILHFSRASRMFSFNFTKTSVGHLVALQTARAAKYWCWVSMNILSRSWVWISHKRYD